jgi:hypothetical protein
MRFEVFTAVTIMMMFFWVWTPCGLTGRSQHFREEYLSTALGQSNDAGNQRDYVGWQKGKYEGKGQSGRSEVEIEPGQWGDSM